MQHMLIRLLTRIYHIQIVIILQCRRNSVNNKSRFKPIRNHECPLPIIVLSLIISIFKIALIIYMYCRNMGRVIALEFGMLIFRQGQR